MSAVKSNVEMSRMGIQNANQALHYDQGVRGTTIQLYLGNATVESLLTYLLTYLLR